MDNHHFFNLKKRKFALLLIGFLVLYYVSATFVDYNNLEAFTAVPAGIKWLLVNFIPTTRSVNYLPLILTKLLETVGLSISSTIIATAFSLLIAILGSKVTGINRFTMLFARVIASFFRNIPLVAWAMILLFSFKQSDFTGFLALFFGSFGYLTRFFMETIEDDAGSTIEALETTGASYFQIIFQGVIPMISSTMLSGILYMIENNIRDATLVGILTGTGVGFLFNLYYKSFRFDLVGMTTLMIIIIVIGLELLSTQIRRLIS
ncbi:ABC transporter permease subunit [Dellaglioa sp. BT-FLS60]